jgi:aldose 1-epimerase
MHDLRSASGITATVSPFGARLVELATRDRDGELRNIVLGFDTEKEYRTQPNMYFGSTVGRVAGRVAAGRFLAGELDFELHPNEGSTHLHGGPHRALDRVDWEVVPPAVDPPESVSSIRFEYTSPAGEEGYPGELAVAVTYELSDDALSLDFVATSDASTPVNLVNHTYWNLSGDAKRPVTDSLMWLRAGEILETDAQLLPTGGTRPVEGTAYDFRAERAIGDRLPADSGEPWPGIDTTYLLDHGEGAAATLWDPASGRTLAISTTEPSLQVYTGNRIPEMAGRGGVRYRPGMGICIEAQRIPDSPALRWSPTIVLEPGREYRQHTVWTFGIR